MNFNTREEALRRLHAFGAAILLLAAACQGWISNGDEQLYRNPRAALGEEVVVCGYLWGGPNLHPEPHTKSGRDPTIGLSIVDDSGAFRPRYGRACVRGVVVRLGCGVEALCMDNNFEYGIRVTVIP